ncbi:MAG TPA: hypothetical protein VM452_10290, partial [Caulifigura sp.]|nr:hypothetical protein [Caulifigura sp.]
RVSDGTTRLILVAIVAGGLLTAGLNLWRFRESSASDDPPALSDDVAPEDDLLNEGLPVVRKTVQGDEAAARAAVVQAFRVKIDEAAKQVAEFQARSAVKAPANEPFEDAVELARDPDGKWLIYQVQDVRRMIVGVVRAGPAPTILFWGGYDETAPGSWATWTMQLPLPEN